MGFLGRFAKISFLILAGAGLFLFIQKQNGFSILSENGSATVSPAVAGPKDIELQLPLANPPSSIKAVYMTSWSASSEKKLNYFIKLIKDTELNAIVIDVKDFSGYVAYNTNLELPKKYKAVETRVPFLNKLVKRLHDEGIYIIGRISVFQDQRLPLARPDLALTSSSTGAIWKDYKGIMWVDPASREAQDYNIAVAKEILERGFDEANFDYIRFASDGNLSDIKHPFWDEKTLKIRVIRDFFQHLRESLPTAKLSADLFGLVTINTDGLGVGQHLEYALPYFDYISPMVYPSHYFKNFLGFENPAEHPYEVVKYSMDTAVRRITTYEAKLRAEYSATTTPMPKIAQLRPWIQDFDLGADYDAAKILSQINAWQSSSQLTPQYNNGWMLWNASNIYTKEALAPESNGL